MNDYSIAKTQPEGHQWPTWTVVFNPTRENISHHESNAEAEAAVARYKAADRRRAARFDLVESFKRFGPYTPPQNSF